MASQEESGGDFSNIYTSGVSVGDFDGDGFVDINVMTAPWVLSDPAIPGGQPVSLHNSGNSNNALTIRLVGTTSNRDGIGALIQVKTKLNRKTDRHMNTNHRQNRRRKHHGRKSHVQTLETRAGSSFASLETPGQPLVSGATTRPKSKLHGHRAFVEKFKVHSGFRTLVEGTGKTDD